ncbi:small RNA 2'-O-methyltransferase [Paramormyrops kingsleyae]|uniref:Small RNA 2'-O-methyltransferase n=1 Tax=Paramormyrops kingsleyae TaxID=1676925 RepID=A0A3B3RMW8_9TELE|nr:small RNA 2'-O-methyltransferase [Paramormyrops kingsleyae]
MFSPSLGTQRHNFVVDFVQQHKPKKVIDLGCADCRLLRRLRFLRDVEFLVGVDIKSSSMKKKMHSLAPFPGEYLQPGNKPLTIELYEGSVTEEDPHTKGFDLATCIELIEHLQLAEVGRFSEVLFGYMEPTAVIVSTPNADFNCLLPGRPKLRIPDHKFEWTQVEFRSWASGICGAYGYTVEFTGVGKVANGPESSGFCSQIGVFNRESSRSNVPPGNEVTEDVPVYNLLYRMEYPSLQNNNIFQRTLVNEVLYWAEHLRSQWAASQRGIGPEQTQDSQGLGAAADGEQPFLHGGFLCIPLSSFMSCPRVRELSGSMVHLRDLLLGDPQVRLIANSVALDMGEEDPAVQSEEPTDAWDSGRHGNVPVEEGIEDDWGAQVCKP